MKPSFLRVDHNVSRVTATFPSMARMSQVPEGNLAWHSWDFSLDPGLYRLAYVNGQSTLFNYFAAGRIPAANQPEPILIQDRFGEVGGCPFLIPAPDGNSFPESESFCLLRVRENDIIRVESYAETRQRNGTPFPPGVTSWVIFPILRTLNGPKVVRIPSPDFGNTRATLCRREDFDDGIVFFAEDGEDRDFNDLIVKLSLLERS